MGGVESGRILTSWGLGMQPKLGQVGWRSATITRSGLPLRHFQRQRLCFLAIHRTGVGAAVSSQPKTQRLSLASGAKQCRGSDHILRCIKLNTRVYSSTRDLTSAAGLAIPRQPISPLVTRSIMVLLVDVHIEWMLVSMDNSCEQMIE